MSVEWDEELVERAFEPWAPAFVGRHREEGCGNWCHEGGDPEHAFMLLGLMAESANTARLEAEAQARHLAVENGRTAARMMMAEDERDALAKKVAQIREMVTLFQHEAVYDLRSDILAILSDQEGRE